MLPDPNDRYTTHRRGWRLRIVTVVVALVAVTVFAGDDRLHLHDPRRRRAGLWRR